MARLEGLKGQCINPLPFQHSQCMSLYSSSIPLLSSLANIASALVCSQATHNFQKSLTPGTKAQWNKMLEQLLCCALQVPTRLKSMFLSRKEPLILIDEGTAVVIHE